MSVNNIAINNTSYIIKRTFGTKSIPELIADNVVKLCNSPNLLTETANYCYNSIESVKEVVDENR